MNSTTRAKLVELTGPHFENMADYDVVSQMMFPDIECMKGLMGDPFYQENVMPDDKNFADMSRTRLPSFLPSLNALTVGQNFDWVDQRRREGWKGCPEYLKVDEML